MSGGGGGAGGAGTERRAGGSRGGVHHYHGRQFCAQPNKIRDVIIISLLDEKWEEAAFGFFLKVRLRKEKQRTVSHINHTCAALLYFFFGGGGLEAGLTPTQQ